MKPEEVPTELVSEAIDVWRMQDGTILEGLKNVLAAVLPTHEAMVRAKVADEIEARALQMRNEIAPYISRDELAAYRHAARVARGDR